MVDKLLYLIYSNSRTEVEALNLMISSLSQTPIYEQIKMQIKELILTGKLEGGAQLPSIRLMAKDLKVGVITVKRAYDDLSAEGFTNNVPGRGVFIADINNEKAKEIHLEMLAERLEEIKDFCIGSGISKSEFERVVNKIYGGLK